MNLLRIVTSQNGHTAAGSKAVQIGGIHVDTHVDDELEKFQREW